MGTLLLLGTGAYCDYGQCRAGFEGVVGYGYDGLVDDSAPISISINTYCGKSSVCVGDR